MRGRARANKRKRRRGLEEAWDNARGGELGLWMCSRLGAPGCDSRPATQIPDHLTTVFAGVDREATERAREHMVGVAPSSPSVALFKDGELVHMLERRHIEMMIDEMVAHNLTEAFDKYCSRQGPSVLREEYEKVVHARQCGSSVPLFDPLTNH